MRSIFLFITFLLFISFSCFSQSWKSGATWKYSGNPTCGPYFTYTSHNLAYVSDTVIDGKACQKIVDSIKYNSYYQLEPSLNTSTTGYKDYFTHASGDTMFYYNDEQFYVLYNFAANVGDSWLIDFNARFNISSYVQVEKKGTVNIGGNIHRWMEVSPTEGSSKRLSGTIIEGIGVISFYDDPEPGLISIGNDSFIFPVFVTSCSTKYSFQRYRDDEIEINPTDKFNFVEEPENISWINPGAKWEYLSIPNCWPDGGSRHTFVYEADSIINGIYCQKIKKYAVHYDYAVEDDPRDSTLSQQIYYTYASGDTVFYRVDDEFLILYNFGADVGEQWLVRIEESQHCNDSSFVQVDSKGAVEIAGQTLRWIEVSPTLGSPYGLHGRIVEGLGMVGSGSSEDILVMEPGFFVPYPVDCFQREMSCHRRNVFVAYEDDIPLTINSGSAVNFIEDTREIINVEEKEEPLNIFSAVNLKSKVYPNPVLDYINIENKEAYSHYSIYALTGEQAGHGELIKELNTLYLDYLQTGTYILELSGTSGIYRQVFIKE